MDIQYASPLHLDADSFPLFTVRDLRLDGILVELLFEELRRPLCVALTFNVTESSQIIAECVLLPAQGLSQMLSQRYEGRTHYTVGNNLAMMGLQQKEDNPRREDKVPLLRCKL